MRRCSSARTAAGRSTFAGTWRNLGETRAQGVEMELEAQPAPPVRLLGQYTFLDSEILVSNDPFSPMNAIGQPLLRRPRHTASFTAQCQTLDRRLTAGATIVRVGERPDSDFAGIGLTTNDAHTRLDARVRARVHRRLEVFAIGENLGDADYHEVLGYPTLGRSLRIGITAKTGS